MKRIITSFLLIGFCIAACVTSSLITEREATALIENLERIEIHLEKDNTEEALKETEKIEERWKKSEVLFSALSETGLIDEVSLSLGSLRKHIEAQSKEEAIAIIAECKNGLEIIHQYQKITIDNVL